MDLLKHLKDNFLMLLVLTLSFFILWNLTDLLARIENQNNGNKIYRYENTIRISFDNIGDMGDEDEAEDVIASYILDEFDSLLGFIQTIGEANISVAPAYIQLPGMQDSVSAEIIIKQNEELPYDLQEAYNEKASVIIGESLIGYMGTDSPNTYIDIGETALSVGGVLRNIGVNGQDERLLICYDSLSDSEKEAVIASALVYFYDTHRVNLTIGSESETYVRDCRNLFSEWVSGQDNVHIQPIQKNEFFGEQNMWYVICHSIFGVISILFAIASVVIVFDLWVQKRRKELLIRKIWGYGNIRILALILKELCLLAAGAIVCSFLLWVVYTLLTGKAVLWSMFGFQIPVMLGGCLAVLVICMCVPYHEIIQITPVAGLSKYRR